VSRLVRFSDCKSSVFISYAHADDRLNNAWITKFASALSQDLEAALSRHAKGRPVPGIYQSQFTGPVGGNLGPELQQQVDRAFAMIIVVDEFYATSDWCLQELLYFKQAFGDEGLDKRLYIIALREEPIRAVTAKPEWQQVFGSRSQVWKSFVDPEDLKKGPVPVQSDDAKSLSNAFFERYQALRESLVERIEADLSVPPPPPPPAPRWVVGACRPELVERVERLVDELAEQEPRIKLLKPEDLLHGKELQALLQGADALILPFNRGQPMYDALDGGHVAQLVGLWKKIGKRDDPLLLDLSDIAAPEEAEPQHLAYLEGCGLPRLNPEQLLDRLCPKPVNAPADAPRRPIVPVRIYIEDHPEEAADEWKKLGAQIRDRWKKLLQDAPVDQQLVLKPLALNMAAIDDCDIDRADGVVLMWGHKDRRALYSQIDCVEDRLADAYPTMVARLSPPQPPADKRLSGEKWQVLRFCARNEPPPAALEPVADDNAALDGFVREVLDKTLTRLGAAATASRRP